MKMRGQASSAFTLIGFAIGIITLIVLAPIIGVFVTEANVADTNATNTFIRNMIVPAMFISYFAALTFFAGFWGRGQT